MRIECEVGSSLRLQRGRVEHTPVGVSGQRNAIIESDLSGLLLYDVGRAVDTPATDN